MELEEVIKFFEKNQNTKNLEYMDRVKVGKDKKYGIKMPILRKLAKEIGKDHQLALNLWKHGFHESRLLATLIEDANQVDEKQLNQWVHDFNSWDICDQACINILIDMPIAIEKIPIWAKSEEEFVKRTAYSLIAVIAVHDKKSENEYFIDFFPILKEGCDDNRNFVKKAVNWAIRSIGKKNLYLNKKAIELSYVILELDYKAGNWIAKNAIKELKSDKVQKKLVKKEK